MVCDLKSEHFLLKIRRLDHAFKFICVGITATQSWLEVNDENELPILLHLYQKVIELPHCHNLFIVPTIESLIESLHCSITFAGILTAFHFKGCHGLTIDSYKIKLCPKKIRKELFPAEVEL